MLLFRAEGHVERSRQAAGAFITPEQMWSLADLWYHDRADAAWRRKTADEAQAVFASIGLIGNFWRLQTSGSSEAPN